MNNSTFTTLQVGSQVTASGIAYTITHLTGIDSFLAQEVGSEKVKQLTIRDLDSAKVELPVDESAVSTTAIEEYSDEEWEIAQKRFATIKPLLANPDRTAQDAQLAADKAEVTIGTIYNWMKSYISAGHISSLIPAKRGTKTGAKMLSSEQEEIILAVINELYLSKQKPIPKDVIQEVNLRCKTAELTPPHANTIRNRINSLPRKKVLSARGRKDVVRDIYSPIRGNFPGADLPLAVVQIDHTPADIIVVEEESRLPLGRPWLTLAIDVSTRMIVGISLSMDPPSAVAVGQCVANAILPKNEYLAKLEVPGQWPVWGKMRTLHADNAKEFRGKMLMRACEKYDIDLQLRPVKVPHYGGHIERLMGVAAGEFRTLPGATFSNPKERKGYDSEKSAALTLKELETRLVDFIVNVYHKRIHSSINMPPIRKWETSIMGDGTKPGVGLPQIPNEPEKLVLDFMPFVERSVQRYGIQIDNIFYYHECLNRWINALDENNKQKKRLFIVRRDPRNLSTVYFYDPDAQSYFAVPYRDMTHPAIDIWELREAQRRLKEDGQKHVDEAAIFDAILRMRARVDEAKHKTKAARRQASRQRKTEKLAAGDTMHPSLPAVPEIIDVTPQPQTFEMPRHVDTDIDDLFAEPPERFNECIVKNDLTNQ